MADIFNRGSYCAFLGCGSFKQPGSPLGLCAWHQKCADSREYDYPYRIEHEEWTYAYWKAYLDALPDRILPHFPEFRWYLTESLGLTERSRRRIRQLRYKTLKMGTLEALILIRTVCERIIREGGN